MLIISDPLDFWLPPPDRIYHFSDQPLSTRWRIERWQSHHLKYAPTEAEIEAIRERAQARLAREQAKAFRLQRLTGRNPSE
jgi:hypothetical protein